MTRKELQTLVSLTGQCSYNEPNKRVFHKLSMRLLRELRKVLGVDAELRYNPAGIACSGDAVLHSDSVYVSFNADAICGLGILYRTCKGRKDYTGGQNNFFPISRLTDEGTDGLAQAIRGIQ